MAWTDASRKLTPRLLVDWDIDTVYTDMTDYLESASGTMQLQPMWQAVGGNAVQPSWTAQFMLKGLPAIYHPLNLLSDIRDNGAFGVPVQFDLDCDGGGFERVFTGYIDTYLPTSRVNNSFTLSCVDNSHPLLQHKTSTIMHTNQRADAWLTILAAEGGVTSTDFDPGLFTIPYCWLDDENIWAEMNYVANAEGGLLFFDNEGTLVFRNFEAWAANAEYSSAQHAFDLSRILDGATPTHWRDVYNEVVSTYSPRRAGSNATLWSLPEATYIVPSATITIDARFSHPALVVDPISTAHYTIIDGAGNAIDPADLSISLTNYAQRGTISITNNSSAVAIVARMHLTGAPIYGYPSDQVVSRNASSSIGDPSSGLRKTLRIAENPYIQFESQARFLSEAFRDRLGAGRIAYDFSAPYLMDPLLLPMYRVRVDYEVSGGAAFGENGYIQSINWSFSGDNLFLAQYNVLDDNQWMPFGSANWFVIGTDVLADVSSKRAFY